jgi:hypothetical protein
MFSSKIAKYFYRFSLKATKHFGNNGISILILFAITQRLHGITSLVPNSGGKHIILGDIENCTLEQVIEEAGLFRKNMVYPTSTSKAMLRTASGYGVSRLLITRHSSRFF